MDSIGSRLKASREDKGWTQAKLAKVAGVSQGTVGNIESGARRSLGSLPRLAEALGVSHNWLRDGGDAAPVVDENQPDATDGKALGRIAVLSAVNILGTCLQQMDAESRKVASHLLQGMAENPAGALSAHLTDLIEKYSPPGLFEQIGISVRAGNYALSIGNPTPKMTSKSGSKPSAAVAASHLPTGPKDAVSSGDRREDEKGSSDRAAGSGQPG